MVQEHGSEVRRWEWGAFQAPSAIETYTTLNERALDQIEVAMTLVELDLELERFRSAVDKMNELTDSGMGSPPALSRKINARELLLASIAESLRDLADPQRVSSELESRAPGVPPEARGEFLALFERAVNRHEPTALPEPQRHIYFEVPKAVLQARRAHFSEYGALYEKLDALLPEVELKVQAGEPDPNLEDELTTLRDEFMNRCSRDCVESPLAGATSFALARLSIIRNDFMNAMSELTAYRSGDRFRVTLARAVGVAQRAAAKKMQERQERVERLMAKGVSESSARKKVGGAAGVVDVPSVSKPEAPDIFEGVPTGAVSPMMGEVRLVRREGNRARVQFAKTRTVETQYFNCRRTNRVDRIHADGRLEYAEDCDHRNVTRVRPTEPDVMVPAAEVAGIRNGDRIHGFRQEGEGRAPLVLRDGRLVRWLGHPVQEATP